MLAMRKQRESNQVHAKKEKEIAPWHRINKQNWLEKVIHYEMCKLFY